jgi:hypothetical protein
LPSGPAKAGCSEAVSIEVSKRSEKAHPPVSERAEVQLVRCVYVRQSILEQRPALLSDCQLPRAAVGSIDVSLQQTAKLELASYLAGHHRVDARLVRQLSLRWAKPLVVLDPPQAGQHDELHMRELVAHQRGADPPLPGERDPPQQEPGASLWRVVY